MNETLPFLGAHAGAATWQQAAGKVVADLGDVAAAHRLGFVYVTDAYAAALDDIVVFLRQTTGVPHWVGTVGLGVCAAGREYFDEPAMAVLVAPIGKDDFRIFQIGRSGPERFVQENAEWLAAAAAPLVVVHADPANTHALELIETLARSSNGFLLGGLTASRGRSAQLADKVAEGEVSGVMISLAAIPVQAGLSQGCTPIGPVRTVTEAQGNLVLEIDGRPALTVFKEEIGEVLARDLRRVAGYIFAALPVPGSDTGDYLVRNLVGIDPQRGIIAIGENVAAGDRIMFCRRDHDSAVADLRRMLADLRKRAGGAVIRGGLYVSCVARGPNQFGQDSRELAIIREELGDFPLAGFYANGEISHDRVYGYTGVLALFL